MTKLMDDRRSKRPPYAPPFIKAGKLVIAQTANILLYLGPRLGLAPRDEAGRLWAHQLQLTISDLVVEIHDSHHPVTTYLYYEEQRPAAKRRTADFWRYRVPKILGYFERVLARSDGPHVLGRRLCYVDLSLFQIIEGLRYAFPKRCSGSRKRCPASSRCTIASPSAPASRPISPPNAGSRSANGGSIAISRSLIDELPGARAACGGASASISRICSRAA
jgi:glutathione S-transferase